MVLTGCRESGTSLWHEQPGDDTVSYYICGPNVGTPVVDYLEFRPELQLNSGNSNQVDSTLSSTSHPNFPLAIPERSSIPICHLSCVMGRVIAPTFVCQGSPSLCISFQASYYQAGFIVMVFFGQDTEQWPPLSQELCMATSLVGPVIW